MLIPLRNLLRRPRRSVLTLLGVVIGVGTYLVLVASSQELVRQFRSTMTLFGSDLIVQQHGATSPKTSFLSPEQVTAIELVPGVDSVFEVVIATTRFAGGVYFFVFGVNTERSLFDHIHLVSGALPSAQDEMLLGNRAAEQMEVTTGDRLGLGNLAFTVTGVYATGESLLDSGAVMSLPTVQRSFNLGNRVNLVFVFAEDPADSARLKQSIETRVQGVEAEVVDEWLASYRQLEMVERFATYLGTVALLLAALGVANTMSLNISERIAELAILRALGWSRWKVARMVVLEGLVLTLVGAIIGVPTASLTLAQLDPLQTTGYLPAAVPLPVAMQGVGVALLAGIIGSLPALLRALRLHPARGLRTY